LKGTAKATGAPVRTAAAVASIRTRHFINININLSNEDTREGQVWLQKKFLRSPDAL
jgi:hypothetical protein